MVEATFLTIGVEVTDKQELEARMIRVVRIGVGDISKNLCLSEYTCR